jgi:hypothetical protein
MRRNDRKGPGIITRFTVAEAGADAAFAGDPARGAGGSGRVAGGDAGVAGGPGCDWFIGGPACIVLHRHKKAATDTANGRRRDFIAGYLFKLVKTAGSNAGRALARSSGTGDVAAKPGTLQNQTMPGLLAAFYSVFFLARRTQLRSRIPRSSQFSSKAGQFDPVAILYSPLAAICQRKMIKIGILAKKQ